MKVSIEIHLPDDQFNAASCCNAFHKQFVGNQDYRDSNIVVFGINDTECGIAIDYPTVQDKTACVTGLRQGFNEILGILNQAEVSQQTDATDVDYAIKDYDRCIERVDQLINDGMINMMSQWAIDRCSTLKDLLREAKRLQKQLNLFHHKKMVDSNHSSNE